MVESDSKDEGIQCVMAQIHSELMNCMADRTLLHSDVEDCEEPFQVPVLERELSAKITSPNLNIFKRDSTADEIPTLNVASSSEDPSYYPYCISETSAVIDPCPVGAAEATFDATYTSLSLDRMVKPLRGCRNYRSADVGKFQANLVPGSTSLSGFSTLIDSDVHVMPRRTQPDGSHVEEILPSESSTQNICKKYKDECATVYPIQKLKYESLYLSSEDSFSNPKNSRTSSCNSSEQSSIPSSDQSVYLHQLMKKYLKKDSYNYCELENDDAFDNSLDRTLKTTNYLKKYGLLDHTMDSMNNVKQRKKYSKNEKNRCSTPSSEDRKVFPSFYASSVSRQSILQQGQQNFNNMSNAGVSMMSTSQTILRGLDMYKPPLPNLCSIVDTCESLCINEKMCDNNAVTVEDSDPTTAGSSPLHEEEDITLHLPSSSKQTSRTNDSNPPPILDLHKIRTLPKLL